MIATCHSRRAGVVRPSMALWRPFGLLLLYWATCGVTFSARSLSASTPPCLVLRIRHGNGIAACDRWPAQSKPALGAIGHASYELGDARGLNHLKP